ncbi:MAG: HEAT repeat domain-containing protein [Planctomycetes bacterium]|nr:HEAT repeat domain-containing protein [Planctomycetota bacterium]
MGAASAAIRCHESGSNSKNSTSSSGHRIPLLGAGLCATALLFGHTPAQDRDPRQLHRAVGELMAMRSAASADRAVVVLGCGGAEGARAAMLLLHDPRDVVRARVYRVFDEIGAPAKVAVPMLLQRVARSRGWERERAARLVLRLDPLRSAAIDVLAVCDNKNYRRDAAKALAEVREARTIQHLASLVDDTYDDVRSAAFQSLGELGEFAMPAVPKLIERLDGPRAPALDVEDIPGAIGRGGTHLRGAARALFEIGSKAVPKLLQRHARGTGREQLRILDLLGNMGEVDAQRRAIHGSLAHADAEVRRIAFECLLVLTLREAEDLPVLLRTGARFPQDDPAARLQRYVDRSDGDPFEVLSKQLKRTEQGVERRLAVQSAGRWPAGGGERLAHCVELLLQGARDADRGVRERTATALTTILGRVETGRAVDALAAVVVALTDSAAGIDRRAIDEAVTRLAKSRNRAVAHAAQGLLRRSRR